MIWKADPWSLPFFRIWRRKAGLRLRTNWPLLWRLAGAEDGPPSALLGNDFDWANKTGTGFVAHHGDETLYLIDRDWFGWPDPPQWSLASYDRRQDRHYVWGDFAECPPAWRLP